MKVLTRERGAQGLTRAQLGARARIHPARVGQIELGRVVPRADGAELRKLADALRFKGEPAELLEEVEG